MGIDLTIYYNLLETADVTMKGLHKQDLNWKYCIKVLKSIESLLNLNDIA